MKRFKVKRFIVFGPTHFESHHTYLRVGLLALRVWIQAAWGPAGLELTIRLRSKALVVLAAIEDQPDF